MTSTAPAHSRSGPTSTELPVVGGRYRPVMEMRRNIVDYAQSMWREHGDVVRLVIGPPRLSREVWMVHHPDGAARVLSGSSWTNFAKRDAVYTEVTHWLGSGLLTAEGEEWTRQKRFVQPLFTKSSVDGYATLMAAEISRVVAEWDRTGEQVLDLVEQMQLLTLRVVLRTLFGDSADAVLPLVRDSFPVIADTIVRRGLGAVRLPRSIPTARIRRGRAAQRDLLAACDAIIDDRRSGRSTGETDLLGRLLAARDGDAALSDSEVRDQVLVFLLAGHETTSTALTFALHLLGRHPEVQDRVRSEARAAFGAGATAAAVATMPWTNAVLQETMRLYPSAPFISRLTLTDDVVLGHPVSEGTAVVVSPWTIHRHPDFWTEPLVFDPQRFLEGGSRHERHRYAWMPFGGGPRACIGQHFSLVEAALALGLLLQEHEVVAVPDQDHLPVDALIPLYPTAPVLSRVRRRP